VLGRHKVSLRLKHAYTLLFALVTVQIAFLAATNGTDVSNQAMNAQRRLCFVPSLNKQAMVPFIPFLFLKGSV